MNRIEVYRFIKEVTEKLDILNKSVENPILQHDHELSQKRSDKSSGKNKI